MEIYMFSFNMAATASSLVVPCDVNANQKEIEKIHYD